MDKQLTTSLTVNRQGIIEGVGDGWREEAAKGGAEEALAQDRVIGHLLAKFISGDNSRMYIEASLSLCRIRRETIYRAYRCDSVTHRRFMELELSPLPHGSVLMQHFLLREELMPQPVEIEDVSYSTGGRPSGLMLRCSMCNSLKKTGTDQWFDPAEVNASQPMAFQVIHTVCDRCQSAVWHKRPSSSVDSA